MFKKCHVKFDGLILTFQFHIPIFDPAQFAADRINDERKHGGKNDADQDQSQPVKSGDGILYTHGYVIHPTGVDADGTYHSTGSHS